MMNPDYKFLLEFVQLLIDRVEEGAKALADIGVPNKTARDIENYFSIIPEDHYDDFIDWLYSLNNPDMWEIIEAEDGQRVRLNGVANFARPFSKGGIAKCFRAGVRQFADFSLIPERDARLAGYNGYKEAVALIECILSGQDTYKAWRAFSKASHRYGRKALCATLLAGDESWQDDCDRIMSMVTL